MDVLPGSPVWSEFEDRYARCCQAFRDGEFDDFLAWAGPEATFIRADGTVGRWADTRAFWEWRFSLIDVVERFDITLEAIRIDEDGAYVVDFHEVSRLLVRNLEGQLAVRVADLHNRNWWRRSTAGLSIINGAEPRAHRTLDGLAIDDADDPVGFAAWARVSAARQSADDPVA